MNEANLIHETEYTPLTPEQRAVRNASPIAVEITLSGKIDKEGLRLALETAISRHDVFKQAFLKIPGFVEEQMIPRSYGAYSFAFVDALISEKSEKARFNFSDFSDGQNIKIILEHTGEISTRLHVAVPSVVADYNSLLNFISEVLRIYDGAALPEPFQYSQYAAWRNSLEEDAKDGLLYWSSYLEEWPLALQLPVHRTGFSAERHSLTRSFGIHLVKNWGEFAKQRETSLETFMQAAWWLLLARLSGQKSYRANWRHDCRSDYEVMMDGIGVFEKHLPIEIDIDFDSPFDSWLLKLSHVLEQHKEAQEFWPVAEPRIANAIQIGFGFTDCPQFGGEKLTYSFPCLPSYSGTGPFYLNIVNAADEISFVVHYDPAQYDHASIESLLDHYEKLLHNIVKCQPILTMRELTSTFEAITFAGPSAHYGLENVAQRVEHWVRETPDAEALCFGTERLSYLDFETKVRELTSFLISKGVQPGMKIVLCANRSERLIIALFAAWRASATYVPLDPAWPETRKQGIIADCGAFILFDGDQWTVAEYDYHQLPIAENKDAPAYVIYTSGSTGLPKGVSINHSALANYVFGASQSMRLGEARRWAMIGSLAADLGYTAIFGALANGGCLVIAEDKDLQDSFSFSRFIMANNIDGMKIVPSQLDALLDSSLDMTLPKKIVLGGEPSDARLVQRIRSISPDCEIYNHYGPTETAIGVMIGSIEPGIPKNMEMLPLTTVLPNNKIYILDAKLNCTLPGGIGELYIGGKQLGHYIKSADRQVFIDSPFERNERLYKSGDLACYLPHGGIRLLGRVDQQIKIRGYRVEAGEVEHALKLCAGVRDAVVLYRDEQLCAYVIGDESAVKKDAMKKTLATSLPDHMIPAYFIFVDKFVRLTSGKIDRQVLLTMPFQQETKDLTAPTDAVEGFLCRTMANLLQRNAIGADQDFFELGGHSLLVIKLLARIRQSLEIDLPPSLFFDHTTPQALALQLRSVFQSDAELERLAAACLDDEAFLQSEVA